MGRMTDEDIGALLRELPRRRSGRARTSSDFTERVLERVEQTTAGERRRGRFPGRGALALGLAAVLGAALFARDVLRERVERSETAERVRELRAEYRDLQAELEKLRALTQEIEPVLELGGTEQVDFVLDLRALPRERDASDRPASAPASHRGARDDARSPGAR
jgi:hypothetical protein